MESNSRISLIANQNITKNNKFSSRFKKNLESFILSIDNLSDHKNMQRLNQILVTLTSFLKENVVMSNIIEHYSEFNNTSITLIGGFNGVFKQLRYCNDKNSLNLIIQTRVDYLIQKLTLAILGEEFQTKCNDKDFKKEFDGVLEAIIVSLHDKYQFKNFAYMYMGWFNFQDCTFEQCDFSYSLWDKYSDKKNIVFNRCNCAYAKFDIAGENIRFISCDMMMTNFVNADIRNISFYDCRFKITQFSSELELIAHASFYRNNQLIQYEGLIDQKKQIGDNYITPNAFIFNIYMNNMNKKLLDIRRYLYIKPSAILDKLKNILSQESNSTETAINVAFLPNGLTVKKVAIECLISSNLPLNSDNLCGILNGNILQFYHTDSLWTWLIANPICPKTRDSIFELWQNGCILNKQDINNIIL